MLFLLLLYTLYKKKKLKLTWVVSYRMGFRKIYFLNLKLSVLQCIQNPAPAGIFFYGSRLAVNHIFFSLSQSFSGITSSWSECTDPVKLFHGYEKNWVMSWLFAMQAYVFPSVSHLALSCRDALKKERFSIGKK